MAPQRILAVTDGSAASASALRLILNVARSWNLDFKSDCLTHVEAAKLLECNDPYDLMLYFRPARDCADDSRGSIPPAMISRGRCPIVVFRSPFSGFNRIVVAARVDGHLDRLLEWGAAWSERLDLPLAVISAARTARQLTCQVRAVEGSLSRLGIRARLSRFRCSAGEFAAKMEATDLLLAGASGRASLSGRRTGDLTQDLIRMAPCAIGFLPAPVEAAPDSALVCRAGLRDN